MPHGVSGILSLFPGLKPEVWLESLIWQIYFPAIRMSNGLVQITMGLIKPGGPLVIEVGQGAVLQYPRCRAVLGQDAVGIAIHYFRYAHDDVRRVQPAIAQLV